MLMKKTLGRRDILLITLPVLVIVLTAVIVVALQSQSSVWAPSAQTGFTVNGMAVCLPHKDTTGPQTMECAFGIKGDDGKYYALSDTDTSYKNVSNLPMGEKVEVSGRFEKGERDIYPTVGTIHVTKVTRQ